MEISRGPISPLNALADQGTTDQRRLLDADASLRVMLRGKSGISNGTTAKVIVASQSANGGSVDVARKIGQRLIAGGCIGVTSRHWECE